MNCFPVFYPRSPIICHRARVSPGESQKPQQCASVVSTKTVVFEQASLYVEIESSGGYSRASHYFYRAVIGDGLHLRSLLPKLLIPRPKKVSVQRPPENTQPTTQCPFQRRTILSPSSPTGWSSCRHRPPRMSALTAPSSASSTPTQRFALSLLGSCFSRWSGATMRFTSSC